jgi:hypothetical protein
MTNHCAVTCPVVTEAVKAATPESKIAMALAAIESEKISIREVSERFDVAPMTLSRAKRKSATVPLGTVADLERKSATVPLGTVADLEKSAKTVGKDGKARRSPASQEDIAKAWAMKDKGASYLEMEAEIGACQRAIRNWLKKPRPEPVSPSNPPPLTLEPPKAEPKPKRPQVPSNLKQSHRKEQKWINERWIPIAQHLAEAHRLLRLEHHRLQSEYAGPQGSLLMVNRWEAIAKLWAESGDLAGLTAATGSPDAVTRAELLSEIERSARVSGKLIGSIEIWTGCKPDPTRYQPTPPPPPCLTNSPPTPYIPIPRSA